MRDRGRLPPGPWTEEKETEDFEAFGLQVVMRRGPGGNWCGYVAVTEGHRLYGKSYNSPIVDPPRELVERTVNIDKIGAINLLCAGKYEEPIEKLCDLVLLIDVHGGLTYSGPGYWTEETNLWWFGFDCAHAGDFVPRWSEWVNHAGEVYRDQAYVEGECKELARQLAHWPVQQKGQ